VTWPHLPNMRLKLTGGDRLRGSGVLMRQATSMGVLLLLRPRGGARSLSAIR